MYVYARGINGETKDMLPMSAVIRAVSGVLNTDIAADVKRNEQKRLKSQGIFNDLADTLTVKGNVDTAHGTVQFEAVVPDIGFTSPLQPVINQLVGVIKEAILADALNDLPRPLNASEVIYADTDSALTMDLSRLEGMEKMEEKHIGVNPEHSLF